MPDSGMPRECRGVVRSHGAWGGRVMTYCGQTARKIISMRGMKSKHMYVLSYGLYTTALQKLFAVMQHFTNQKTGMFGLKMLNSHWKWQILRTVFHNLFFKEEALKRNMPKILKKMHCFKQLVIYPALYLGKMVSSTNIFCRESENAFSEQTAEDRTSLHYY